MRTVVVSGPSKRICITGLRLGEKLHEGSPYTLECYGEMEQVVHTVTITTFVSSLLAVALLLFFGNRILRFYG